MAVLMMQSWRARLPSFLIVLAAHSAILWAVMHSASTIQAIIKPAEPVLVSLILAPEVVAPTPSPPKPQPIPKPEKRIVQEKKPKNVTTPSEVIPQPDSSPTTSEVSLPVAKVDTAAAPQVQEAPVPPPVSPPRFDAAYLDNPKPAYPPLSRRLMERGTVKLRVYVAANGQAEKVELNASSGFSRLDNAAIDAVKRWRFIPAKQGDRIIAGWVLVPVDFSLDS